MDPVTMSGGVDRAQEYVDTLFGLWPIVVLSGGVAFCIGLPKIRNSYKQQSRGGALLNQFVRSLVTGTMTAGFVLLLPMLNLELNPMTELGISIFLGAIGAEMIQTLVMKRLGLHIFDPMSHADMEILRGSLTPEQRESHVHQCVFREHGDDCPPSPRTTDN